jgi:hypothetical protein
MYFHPGNKNTIFSNDNANMPPLRGYLLKISLFYKYPAPTEPKEKKSSAGTFKYKTTGNYSNSK